MITNPELLRQHEAHKARRARMVCRAIVPPTVKSTLLERAIPLPALVQHDAHVYAFWSARMVALPVRILRATSVVSGFSLAELKGRRQTADFAKPRQVAMYLIIEDARSSLSEAARHVNRDHATALHAYRKVSDLVSSGDRATIKMIAAIRAKIAGAQS